MPILSEHDAVLRTDVHPLAMLEDNDAAPMMECAVCELPVPEEANGNIFCCQSCEDTAMNEALLEDAINEAVRQHRSLASMDTFAQMFPAIAALPEPEMPTRIACSCCC